MSNIRIELVSDTASRPTSAMREAMATAKVGDESRGEDPSVNELCRRIAEMTGKQAAIFLPSGTMCNQIALLVHCRPGDEILLAKESHISNSEGAGAAALAGAFVREVDAVRGLFSPDVLPEAMRPKGYARAPRTGLVAVEQTHNAGGGSIWPLAQLRAVGEAARREGLKLHMDGARLLNAVVASGTSCRDYCDVVDSAWIDLSKGLGCPVGGVLAGDRDFIAAAWPWKLRLGGAMRQAGILAAAGIYALDHHMDRLAEDHTHAQMLASALDDMTGIEVILKPVETNLVFFDVVGTGMTSKQFADKLLEQGIRVGCVGQTVLRAVTHLDVSHENILETIRVIHKLISRGS